MRNEGLGRGVAARSFEHLSDCALARGDRLIRNDGFCRVRRRRGDRQFTGLLDRVFVVASQLELKPPSVIADLRLTPDLQRAQLGERDRQPDRYLRLA